MGFSLEERERRYRVVRANMEKAGLDDLIVFGSTAVGGQWNGNFTYLSNYCLFFSTALLLFPLEGNPTMFVPGENQYLDAKRNGWMEDLRLSSKNVGDLCTHLKSRKRRPGRIGISSMDAFPLVALQELQAELPGCEIVEGASAVFSARMVKSDEEIEATRRAGRVCDKGWERCMESIRRGITERQLLAEMEAAMTSEGASSYFNMVSAGQPEGEEDAFSGYVISPTSRAFQDRDLVLLEITPRVEGYWSQIVRLVSFGEPPDHIVTAHEACVKAKSRALAHLRPHEECAAVAEAILDVSLPAGYFMKEVGSAHFASLDLSEALLTTGNRTVLEAGMTVALHPSLETGKWCQMFIGETYAVTASGPEALNRSGAEIHVVR